MNSYTLLLEELKLALILAYASAFAYNFEMDKLEGELENEINITSIKPFNLPDNKSPDISGFLGTYQDYMLIAFRGSTNFKDWKANLRFWQNKDIHTPVEKDNSVHKVHGGFDQLINKNWHELLSLVEEYNNKSRKLLLTGHSLGGALAVLTSNRLISKRISSIQIQAVYTYGAPRVGDLNFQNAYNQNLIHYRFEYGNDPVPHVPPTFKHTGKIIYLPKVLGNGNQVDILCEDPKLRRVPPIVRRIAKSGVGVARVVQGIMSPLKNKDMNRGIEYIQEGIDIISKSDIKLLVKQHEIKNYIDHILSYWVDKYPYDYLKEELRKS